MKQPLRIYLASPYSHSKKEIMEYRWSRVSAICAQIFATGEFFPWSPIAHSHCLVTEGKKHFDLDLNGNFEMWEAYDYAFMPNFNEMWILQLEGWQESTGIKSEIVRARELGLPIHYVPDETFTKVYLYKNSELGWKTISDKTPKIIQYVYFNIVDIDLSTVTDAIMIFKRLSDNKVFKYPACIKGNKIRSCDKIAFEVGSWESQCMFTLKDGFCHTTSRTTTLLK